MFVILNRKTLVASLVQVPLTRHSVVRVVPLGVCQSEPLAELRHATVLQRPDDQMPVVGHQTIGKDLRMPLRDRFGQNPLEGFIIFILLKDLCSSIGSIQDMVEVSGNINPGCASHESSALQNGKKGDQQPEE